MGAGESDGRLPHYVSVLSKRNPWLELEAKAKGKEDIVAEDERVAPPQAEEVVAGEEAVVAQLAPQMVSQIVAFEDEDVVVSGVAASVLAVSVGSWKDEVG